MAVYAEIRRQVGPDFPIGIKLNSADFQKGGFTEEESMATIEALSAAGIDLIEISGGTYEAPAMSGVVEHYDRRRAVRFLNSGEVVIFAAGTGNPFFTTDSAACLRGIEIEANLILKATKVDGVYNKDPSKYDDAVKYDNLTFDQVLDEKLGVMDLTAICLCRDHNVPLQVFDMNKSGSLLSVVMGEKEGTHVTN